MQYVHQDPKMPSDKIKAKKRKGTVLRCDDGEYFISFRGAKKRDPAKKLQEKSDDLIN